MSRLVRNVFSNWVGLGLGMAVALFMSPFLVRSLGDAWYGLWVLVISTTGYMGLIDGGLRVSIVKYVARLDATNETEELNRIVSTAMTIYLGLALVVIAGSIGLSIAFPYIFSLAPELVGPARIVVLIAGLSLAIVLASSVFGGFVAGLQRYDIGNAVGVVTLVLRTIAIVALILAGYGIIALGLVHLTVQVTTAIATVIVVHRLRPAVHVSVKLANRESAKTLYGYSFVILVNALAELLLFKTGELLAGIYLGTTAVTYYAIAGTLAEYIHKIIIQMTMVLHPYSSAKQAQGDTVGLRTAAVLSTKFCLLIGLPATIVMLVIGHPFIAAWMGPQYAVISAPVMAVLAVGRLLWIAQSGTGQVLLGIGRHKQVALINCVTGALSFLGGLLLVRTQGGLFWMAVGVVVPLVLVYGLYMPFYTIKALAIAPREYFREGLLRPVAAAVPFAVALFALRRWVAPGTLPAVALVVLGAAPVYLLSTYALAFSADERRRWMALVPPRLRFAARG